MDHKKGLRQTYALEKSEISLIVRELFELRGILVLIRQAELSKEDHKKFKTIVRRIYGEVRFGEERIDKRVLGIYKRIRLEVENIKPSMEKTNPKALEEIERLLERGERYNEDLAILCARRGLIEQSLIKSIKHPEEIENVYNLMWKAFRGFKTFERVVDKLMQIDIVLMNHKEKLNSHDLSAELKRMVDLARENGEQVSNYNTTRLKNILKICRIGEFSNSVDLVNIGFLAQNSNDERFKERVTSYLQRTYRLVVDKSELNELGAIKELGRGANGVVFLARYQNKKLVLKIPTDQNNEVQLVEIITLNEMRRRVPTKAGKLFPELIAWGRLASGVFYTYMTFFEGSLLSEMINKRSLSSELLLGINKERQKMQKFFRSNGLYNIDWNGENMIVQPFSLKLHVIDAGGFIVDGAEELSLFYRNFGVSMNNSKLSDRYGLIMNNESLMANCLNLEAEDNLKKGDNQNAESIAIRALSHLDKADKAANVVGWRRNSSIRQRILRTLEIAQRQLAA